VMESGAALPSTPEQQVIALPPGLAGGGWYFGGSSVYDIPPSAAIAADGSFQLAGVLGRVQLDASVAESIVKSITLDGRDITDEVLDVTGRTAVSGLVITMTDKIPTITGQVRGRDGQPVRKYSVVLLPRESLEPAAVVGRIRTARADENGRFQLRRVRPGRYVVAAVEYVEMGEVSAPEFQQRIRGIARDVTISEGQTLTLDLTITPGI